MVTKRFTTEVRRHDKQVMRSQRRFPRAGSPASLTKFLHEWQGADSQLRLYTYIPGVSVPPWENAFSFVFLRARAGS
jgi:hypothetical protein